MIKVSVIIPAYNSEKYISRCLDSVLGQTMKDIEIIVVNDGSTDKTLDILKGYKAENPEIIKIIDQQNQGQSNSRNNGIRVTEGEYIAFVDSDDYIEPNMLEVLFEKAEKSNAEVVVGDTNCVYPNKSVIIKSGVDFESQNLNTEQKKALLFMYPVVWNKIYKKSFLIENELFFESGMWFEDVLFINKMVSVIKSISFVEDVIYNYIQHPNSITYTYSEKLLDLKLMLDKTLEIYKEKKLYDEYYNELEYMYARYMLATYIKRLSKAKSLKRFKEGIKFAKRCVKNAFPDYRKNPYVNFSAKGIYLKFFNSLFAYVIYFVERNKMN